MNEFKISTLRQFGSENVSFTSTVQSKNMTLSDKEIADQIEQISKVINKAFIAVQEREISEKQLLADASERRTAEVRKLDEALKVEMEEKKKAQETITQAQRLSDKIMKK